MGVIVLPQFSLTAWLALASISYLAWTFIYAFLLSPLRKVPGPWWARVTRMPQWYANHIRQRTAFSTRIYEKYGKESSIVIIAPNEVFTTDEAAIKPIFNKDSKRVGWYGRTIVYQGNNSILGDQYREALPFRQDMLRLFSGTHWSELVTNVTNHFNRFLSLVDADAKTGKDINMAVFLRLLALDVVMDVSWGEKETFLDKARTSTEPPQFLKYWTGFSMYVTQTAFFPVLKYWIDWSPFGTKQWREYKRDRDSINNWALDALVRWQEEKDHRQRDYMNAMRARGVSEASIIAHSVEVIAAGSGTVERTACIAITHLKDRPEVQERLRKELTEAFPSKDAIHQERMLELPYLDAFIKESTRLDSAVPGPQQRYLGSSMVVSGIHIPSGTIASVAPHDQGRLPDVFPDPLALRPERWLATETSKEHLSRMNHNWLAFGTGVRTCSGMKLALLEMKMIVGNIVRLYKILDARDHPTANLESMDLFVRTAKNRSCWVRLEEVES